MEPGFLVDRNYTSYDTQLWVQGLPKKGLLGSLPGSLVGYDMVTFRCTQCGALESYVPKMRARTRSRRSSR
jgi:hypothetical protein